MGMMPRHAPRSQVAGIFSLGLYEFDSAYGFVSLDVAKRLLGKDSRSISSSCGSTTSHARREVAEAIPATLGADYVAQDWTDMNSRCSRRCGSRRWRSRITIGLIVMVAALNIVASLILLVMEKSRDIAILKTMGVGARSITRSS